MLVPDRRRRLLDQVRKDGSAQVEHLSAALDVSASTIRRDLADLEAEGLLRRTRGGAFLQRVGERTSPAPVPDQPETDAAKQRIGRTALEHVADDMTIMLLGGSTTSAMIPFLAGRSLTVVTNGLDVAHALAAYPDISLVVLGGVLHRDQMTLLGPLAEQNMADLHIDVMFAGAYGIHPATGVTGAKIIQAGHHHSMLRHTDRLVVLADASKFGRRGPTLLARIDQVDTIIADDAAPAPVVSALRDQGADVTLC